MNPTGRFRGETAVRSSTPRARSQPRFDRLGLFVLAFSASIALANDVIELKPASGAASTHVSKKIPPLELSEDERANEAAVLGPRTILNIPEAFSEGALGGVEAEALVMGPPGRWTPRVGSRYLTEGVGYDESFAFFSGMVPLSVSHGESHELGFIEATGGVARESQITGSIEFVDRSYVDGGKGVTGDYSAFDYRDSEIGSYRQIAFGRDWLGVNRESRYNVYIPLGRNQKVISRNQTTVPFGTAQVQAIQTNLETAMYGGDAEYGWRILPLDTSGIWGLLGGYHFQAGGVKQVWGVKARVEIRIQDFARLSVEYQRDSVFESNVVFAFEAVFPGWRPRGRADCYITDRLGESIQRWRTVTLARSSTFDFL
jgi:hypothetical protein